MPKFCLACFGGLLLLQPLVLLAQPSASRSSNDQPVNFVLILADDLGYSDLGCYGGEIATPNLDALAAGGLRYTGFRTCAMCSPTRAALMTGLNHHSAGMGWLADVDSGYPGYRGDMTFEAATLSEILRDRGWSTLHVGKWHVNLSASNGPPAPTTTGPPTVASSAPIGFRVTRPTTSSRRSSSMA